MTTSMTMLGAELTTALTANLLTTDQTTFFACERVLKVGHYSCR
jgi:hypothetical protein